MKYIHNNMTAEEFLGIKEYLKNALKLDIRNDLNGNSYICLLLEDDLLSAIKLNFEENDRV